MSDISYVEIEHPQLKGDDAYASVPESTVPVFELGGWKRASKSRSTTATPEGK